SLSTKLSSSSSLPLSHISVTVGCVVGLQSLTSALSTKLSSSSSLPLSHISVTVGSVVGLQSLTSALSTKLSSSSSLPLSQISFLCCLLSAFFPSDCCSSS